MSSVVKRAATRATELTARRFVSLLSRRMREAMLDNLLKRATPHRRSLALLELARTHNIKRFTADGAYGEVTSEASDATVFLNYAKTGQWATGIVALVRETLAPQGGTYIDIGANIGLTTIPIAENSQVDCYAFEPEPKNFANLMRNVRANCQHANVVVHNLAVADAAGSLDFEIAEGNLGDHRIHAKGAESGLLNEDGRHVISVDAVRLDDSMPRDIKRPLVVKIDTQGAEPLVVAGGEETLSQADLLVMEFWPYGMSRLGVPADRVLEFLRAHFAVATLTFSKGEIEREPQSIESACDVLHNALLEGRDDPEYFFDISARKEVVDVRRATDRKFSRDQEPQSSMALSNSAAAD